MKRPLRIRKKIRLPRRPPRPRGFARLPRPKRLQNTPPIEAGALARAEQLPGVPGIPENIPGIPGIPENIPGIALPDTTKATEKPSLPVTTKPEQQIGLAGLLRRVIAEIWGVR